MIAVLKNELYLLDPVKETCKSNLIQNCENDKYFLFISQILLNIWPDHDIIAFIWGIALYIERVNKPIFPCVYGKYFGEDIETGF